MQAAPAHPETHPAEHTDPEPTEAYTPLAETTLTEFEENLLCGITALAPDETAKFAEQMGLSELQLALWLKKPHIAEAHQTLREFRAQQRKNWQEEVTRDVVENLRDIMHKADDPIERRRAATAILRAFNRPTRRASRATRHTQATAGAAPLPRHNDKLIIPKTVSPLPNPEPQPSVASQTPIQPSVASSLSRSVASPTTQQPRLQHGEVNKLNLQDQVGADRNQPASRRPHSSASLRDPHGPAPGRSRQASARPPPLPL